MAGTGQVGRLIVTAGGSDYTSVPTVTLTGGGGAGAAALAVVSSSAVIGLLITAPGTGYTSAPTVSFSGGGGTGAAATAELALASYATVADFLAYLPQVQAAIDAGEVTAADVQAVLDRATGICNDASVGLGFAFAGYTVESRTVVAPHGPILLLPPHQAGSVYQVRLTYGSLALVAGTDYQVAPEGNGRHEALCAYDWGGRWYDVIAAWGFGPPPPSAVEVCLEVAVNLWQSRKAGRFTNVVGASDGGAVGYEGALTPQQKSVLAGLRQAYLREVIAI